MVKSVLFSKQKDKDKEKEKEKEKEELLMKKRLEPDVPRKEVDMVKLKKKVNEIMNSICESSNSEIKDNMDYLYQSMHKNYILNEFNSNCLNYINKIILDAKKNHLQKYQGIFELNKLFISIIKELLMNEFELLLFSLYLESVDISLYNDIFTFEESFTFLCFFIKKLTLSPDKLSPINSFLIRKYQGFEDKFNKWFQLNSSIFNNKLYFSYTEINKRFKEYNSSYSIYCKNNYIDYNLIIDRILTMSIPYNEGKNDNLFVDRKDNSTDLLLENNSNNNLKTNSIKSFGENKNNINNIFLSSNKNYTNNDFSKKINKNNLYNNSYITGFPNGMFNTKKINNINFDYLLNRNNIIYNSINNKKNNERKFNTELVNKEASQSKQNEPGNKKGINFKVTNNSNEEKNKNNLLNNKLLFIVEEDKKKEETNNNIINNLNSNETSNSSQDQRNTINKDNKKEVSITPNNLLYSLENIDEGQQNNKVGNNIQFNSISKNPNIFNNNINNNNINNINNIIIRKNELINNNANNLTGYLSSQQINDYNNLRYNSNLGLNQFNNPSQGSFTLERNQYYNELNNFYHNSLHGIEQEDNLRQLINQSNENLFRSCLSLNHSSKFFYPILPVNYENNNITVDPNINNFVNQPIAQALPINQQFLHLNNNITIGKDNITLEKKNDNNI